MEQQKERNKKHSRVVSVRMDRESAIDIERLAKRMNSSKSQVIKMSVSRILREADAGIIRLLPEDTDCSVSGQKVVVAK